MEMQQKVSCKNTPFGPMPWRIQPIKAENQVVCYEKFLASNLGFSFQNNLIKPSIGTSVLIWGRRSFKMFWSSRQQLEE